MYDGFMVVITVNYRKHSQSTASPDSDSVITVPGHKPLSLRLRLAFQALDTTVHGLAGLAEPLVASRNGRGLVHPHLPTPWRVVVCCLI